MKQGKIIKHDTDVVLFAGSILKITDENGNVILDENGQPKEYMLGSDISISSINDMRLFEVE